MAHGSDEEAFVGRAWEHSGPTVAAGGPAGARIECETAFDLLFVGVTLEAVRRKDGEHF